MGAGGVQKTEAAAALIGASNVIDLAEGRARRARRAQETERSRRASLDDILGPPQPPFGPEAA